ncbi:MAG: glycosyl hydrolase [Cytophagales bacterium]|nr:glycosyl hydrolase [Cytophagales bacterium]
MTLRLFWFAMTFFALNIVKSQAPADPKATRKTRNLLTNLHALSEAGFMLGHEDAQAYGVSWRTESEPTLPNQSDIKRITGSFPAVHGWDLGRTLDQEKNIDSVRFDHMLEWVKATFKRRGINTFSWHLDNLISGGDSWDRTKGVAQLLPGGNQHQKLLKHLDLLADFFNLCRLNGTRIPVIFRPWHEHNGNWFWWGKGNISEGDYIELFRFTVDYLRNIRKIHHVLICFSPDRGALKLNKKATEHYLYGYPGDDYVDIIGLDNYVDVGRTSNPLSRKKQRAHFIESLQLITKIAQEKGKVAALSETGLEGVKKPNWFTELLLNPIKENSESIAIAWVLLWRNANTMHHYAAYPGHASEADFLNFQKDDQVFFESDLDNPYRKGMILPILKNDPAP